MNRGPVIFFSAFLAFAISFAAFVLASQIQIGRQPLTTAVGSGDVYPSARSGQAAQGAQIYRAEGCAACHSQQVRQSGIHFDLFLTEPGTNYNLVISAISEFVLTKHFLGPVDITNGLPKFITTFADKSRIDDAQGKFKSAGAKTSVQIKPFGPDIARGWGARRSVAADYLFDYPVMLGSQRIGPDLANVGKRLPDATWHLLHLYNPSGIVKGSVMPPYRFLFVTRKVKGAPSADAVLVKDGHEVVPTDDARALVAYLQSLHVETPLFEAPMTPPSAPPVVAPDTNAIVK